MNGGNYRVFRLDATGPLYRAAFDDLEEATRKAQEFATAEGFEFFVVSITDHREVGRYFPVRENG
jgi:hypothetical protein